MRPGVLAGPAIVATGDGRFSVGTIEVDPPGPGEVRITLAAAGVCHTDHASLTWRGPMVMGHEGAGQVESVGPGVTRVAAGQNVLLNWAIPCGACPQCNRGAQALCERTRGQNGTTAGTSRAHEGNTRWNGRQVERAFLLGTFSRHTLVREEAVTPLPDHLSCEAACIIGCAVMTGVGSAVNIAAVSPGDSVAVLGCGGVGLNVVQGARLAGAGTIIAIDRGTARLDRARTLGATHALPACDEPGRVIAQVLQLTGGRGVDHAFEATGRPALALMPLRLARNGGNAVQLSGAHGPCTIELRDFFWNKRYITPLYGGCVPERDFPRLFEWARTGDLEIASLVSHTYPLERLDLAFTDMLSGSATKAVLVVS